MKILKALLMVLLACPGLVFAEPLELFREGWVEESNKKESSPFRVPHENEAIMVIHGKVREINKELPFSRLWPDTSAQVQTKRGMITVMLGPAWYLSQHTPQILPGDVITVKGSRVLFREVDTILAGEVGKGNKVLKLRDNDGRPLWILEGHLEDKK